jgi:hypothetical protein
LSDVSRVIKRCHGAHQPARLLVLVGVNGLEQVVDAVLFAPVLGVFELLQGIRRTEATRAEEAPGAVSL